MKQGLFILLILSGLSVCRAQEKLYVKEDFSHNMLQWPLGNTEAFEADISNGFLHLHSQKSLRLGNYYWRPLFIDPAKEFSIEAALTYTGGNDTASYGLSWGSRDQRNAYAFTISPDGRAHIRATVEGTYFRLMPETRLSIIKPAGQMNTLTIERQNNDLVFLINNEVVFTTSFRNFYSHKAGFVCFGNSSLDVDYFYVAQEEPETSAENLANGLADRRDLYWLLNDLPQDADTAVFITGKVVSAKDNKPLGARVLLFDYQKHTTVSDMLCDSLGRFLMVVSPSDSFGVKAYAEGFLPVSMVAVHRSSVIEVNIEMQKLEVGAEIRLRNVFFERGDTLLLAGSHDELDRLAEIMLQVPAMTIELGGHTDNQGNAKKNEKLSEDRVAVVKRYLTGKGIDPKRITGIGYGGSKPIAPNDDETTRKYNRRVEFKILSL